MFRRVIVHREKFCNPFKGPIAIHFQCVAIERVTIGCEEYRQSIHRDPGDLLFRQSCRRVEHALEVCFRPFTRVDDFKITEEPESLLKFDFRAQDVLPRIDQHHRLRSSHHAE